MVKPKLICAAMLLLALASPIEAHYVWLERDDDGAVRAYLGEWQGDIREKTGGLLDRIKTPRAFIASADRPANECERQTSPSYSDLHKTRR